MADKSINQLNPADKIQNTDLFVLQQNNEAKSLPGQVLLSWLTAAADGHGGIANIAKTGTVGLVDTYTITLADTTTYTFTVSNGAKGDKGDTGEAWYLHIKYAINEPVKDSDMLDTINNWIGIYSGLSETEPTSYLAYEWFQLKGEKGEKGDTGTSIQSQTVSYLGSTSPTIPPSGSWSANVPSVPQGQYVWTRTVTTFTDTLEPLTTYSVARMGMDGKGTVSSVNNLSPDSNHNVEVTAENISLSSSNMTSVADGYSTTIHDVIRVTLPSVSESSRSYSVTGITANHVLVQDGCAYLSNPAAADGPLTLETSKNMVVVSGTLVGTTDIVATFGIEENSVNGTVFEEEPF